MTKRIKNMILPLLILFGGVYLFYFPNSVDKDELKQITGVLVDSPKFHDVGVPGNKSIDFNLKNNTIDFDIESCAYNNLNVTKFLSLKKGDSLKLLVRKKRTFRQIINRDIDCYDIRSTNDEVYLNLSESNNCSNNSWKIILALGVACLLLTFIKRPPEK